MVDLLLIFLGVIHKTSYYNHVIIIGKGVRYLHKIPNKALTTFAIWHLYWNMDCKKCFNTNNLCPALFRPQFQKTYEMYFRSFFPNNPPPPCLKSLNKLCLDFKSFHLLCSKGKKTHCSSTVSDLIASQGRWKVIRSFNTSTRCGCFSAKIRWKIELRCWS